MKAKSLLMFTGIHLIAVLVSNGQPAIQWQNTIGGFGFDELFSARQTSDGGYILGGYSDSEIFGDKTEDPCVLTHDFWIVKTDMNGIIQWQNTIGGSGGEQLYAITQTSDGGYIFGGYSASPISCEKTENNTGFLDFWIVKTDANGNIQWQNTIGGNGIDGIWSIQQTADGGFILGGKSDSGISGDKTEASIGLNDFWVVKLDASGSIQWQNTIGGTGEDELFVVRQTSDGGYILGGSSDSGISGDKTEVGNGLYDYWIVKTDLNGTIQWQNTIGGSGSDLLSALEQTPDGGYILGGRSTSGITGDKTETSNGAFDYWIIKIDGTGIIQWQNTVGGDEIDILTSLALTADGGYIAGGYSRSGSTGDKTEGSRGFDDYWIVRLDNTGLVMWEKTLGASNHDWLYAIQQTTDGGYFLGGISDSDISGEKSENSFMTSDDFWIIKLGPDSTSSLPETENNPAFYISPNPALTEAKITFKNPLNERYHFLLSDMLGSIIQTSMIDGETIIASKADNVPGIYFFTLISEISGNKISGKITFLE